MFEELPKTRDEAIRLGSVSYFTGEPCKHGHIDKRYTKTNWCYACKRRYNANDYSLYTDRVKESTKKSYINNKENARKCSRNWALKNPDKVKAIKKKNKDKYHDKYLENEKLRVRNKRRSDPYFRLCRNMSKAVWEWLNGRKGFQHWCDIVGYSAETLICHLQSKFKPGMTWDNYGCYWHVDHVKPLSKCRSFEEAWDIGNLQPLEALENLKKHNKYSGEFDVDGRTDRTVESFGSQESDSDILNAIFPRKEIVE